MTRPSYVYACPCGYETTKGSNARRHAKTCVHDTMTKTRATTGATTTGATTTGATTTGATTTGATTTGATTTGATTTGATTTGATTTGATTNDPTADDVLWTHRLYALGLGFGGQTDPVPPMPPGYGVRV